MDTGKMKNMVVLRNLPSNLIDEAIIILKPNKTIKKFDYVKNNEKSNVKKEEYKSNSNNYVINEAEMVIANYISNIEEQNKMKKRVVKNIEYKYKILKTCTFLLTTLIIINAIFDYLKV